MAEPIKHLLNRDAVAWLAKCLLEAWPAFDDDGFRAACLDGLEQLALKQRAAHIARCMGQFLPQKFPEAANVIAKSLGPPVPATGENGLSVLRYFAHDSFIEQFGLDHPEASFALQAEVTRRASCEFSIRAFLLKYPDKTYAQLVRWAKSDDPHHRRLASEGIRPRLPWGQRLPQFIMDPTPVVALLEFIKDDPVRYVQRSVANTINDISKDHPDVAVRLCERWMIDAGPNRQWVIKHALRDLVKKGHPAALTMLGAGGAPKIQVADTRLSPSKPRIGGKLDFECTLLSIANEEQQLIVDFIIDYVKASRKTSPKVFKLSKLSLAPKAEVRLKGGVSLADMTTRKHHPGRHQLSLQVNGKLYSLATFDLAKPA